MRKTKLGLFLLTCVAIAAMMLSGCGESANTASTIDPARVEKTVLSAINKAIGAELNNDESLRKNAEVIWNKVDDNGKIQWVNIWYSGQNADGTYWSAQPIANTDKLDENSKMQLVEFTEEVLKKYENPSEELLEKIKVFLGDYPNSKLTSICVTAKKINGKVYVVCVQGRVQSNS